MIPFLNCNFSGLNWFCKSAILFLLLYCWIAGCDVPPGQKAGPVKILILSGQNNHEWEKTTAVLLKMYRFSADMQVTLTEDPTGLTYVELKKYDVIVSNWNNWPDNDIEWDPIQEEAFRKYIEEGGGAVFFHAGASSYYNSEIYHEMGIGRWGKETSHGKPTLGKITKLDQDHPVTRGLDDFYITDEIWEKTDIHPGAEALASISAGDEDDGHLINENAVFVSQMGKGRCFYTILGHDERALFNTGLQTLLLRATEWAATGSVTMEVPQDLQIPSDVAMDDYSWHETDTSLQLLNGPDLIWRYNFRNRFGKPYFHPLYLNDIRLTCESPTDHVWHYGLWFSWKFINGLNYWEYTSEFSSEGTGFKSEGITDIQHVDVSKNKDQSANIQLDILYHPMDGDPVLREDRKIYVSPPDERGEYYFDYKHHFLAEFEDIILDRTPILGEPDGKSWGGYGGLSIRFNQDFTLAEMIPPVVRPDYPKRDWFFMGFNSLRGEMVGIAMFQHPEYTTSFTRWYYVTDPVIPFYYFSPAAVYDSRIELKKGESLELKYRVWILSGIDEGDLQDKFNQYAGN